MVGPRPANPFTWDVVVRSREGYRVGRYSWLGAAFDLDRTFADARADPRWPTIEEAAEKQAPGFLNWARYPWLEIEDRGGDDLEVFLMDARYVRHRTAGFGGARITIARQLLAWPAEVDMTVSRRRFLEMTALASVVDLVRPSRARGRPSDNPASASERDRARPGPVAIASGNGLRGVEKAVAMMSDGRDPLDAAVTGVEIQELDAEDQSVGLGGLPNADGVVQLDASCMHGPTRRAGAVGALEDVATAARVAQAVLENTDHVLLVGEGARRFALDLGFEERDLLTTASRQAWLRWKRRLNPHDDWLDPDDGAESGQTHGTINLCALDEAGDLASVTSTSGLSWKIPGRVGDSPLVGAGQYCDNRVGAAGATGRGEAAIQSCGSFLVVELMRSGNSPTEACKSALRRAVEMSEARLKTADGRPLFGLTFYALAKDGRYGCATMYERPEEDYEKGRGFFAVADSAGARLERPASLFAVDERPSG